VLRCGPGQRAVVWQGPDGAEAECADASLDRFASMQTPVAYQMNQLRPILIDEQHPTSRRESPARAQRSSGPDWQRTALVIGGASAAGAGLRGIFGGKKGALVGAAIGGGATSIRRASRRQPEAAVARLTITHESGGLSGDRSATRDLFGGRRYTAVQCPTSTSS
jgi:hypothetical protein